MITNTGIVPNKIRIHPVDLRELISENILFFQCEDDGFDFSIIKLFGLEVVETIRVEEGTAEIYNDEYFIEVKK